MILECKGQFVNLDKYYGWYLTWNTCDYKNHLELRLLDGDGVLIRSICLYAVSLDADGNYDFKHCNSAFKVVSEIMLDYLHQGKNLLQVDYLLDDVKKKYEKKDD